jgi:hypothetical protein
VPQSSKPFAHLCVLAFAVTATVGADPPAQKSKSESQDRKGPTTTEEFAELASQGPRPPWKKFRNQVNVHVDHIDGTVVAVSAESIEIQLKGKKETVKYPPHTLLESGAVCHWENDCNCYLLEDVRKGDVVVLGVGIPEQGADTQCFYISIRKRPEGVVPPSRKPSSYPAYHDNQQAEIDHEEKGTPLPEHLREKVPGPGEPPFKKKTIVSPAGDPPKK